MTDNLTAPGGPPQQPEQILLVDDNVTNLQVLHQTLDGRGFKLLVAKNGAAPWPSPKRPGPP